MMIANVVRHGMLGREENQQRNMSFRRFLDARENNNGVQVTLTFTELRERDGPIVDLIRTRPDVQTGFVADSH